MNSVSSTGMVAFNFPHLSGCSQLINELTHKLGNCLDKLLTNVSGVVDNVVDPILGNSDHSSIAFSLKMDFNIPKMSFSGKVCLILWKGVFHSLEKCVLL